jgi:hypothetical protein
LWYNQRLRRRYHLRSGQIEKKGWDFLDFAAPENIFSAELAPYRRWEGGGVH